MDILGPDKLQHIVLTVPPLLLSLTIHEYAHARTAQAFGDDTARLQGRVSLNPLAHLDLVGTLALIFTNVIGWAKPVPINPANLRPLRLGNFMVSLAGPFSNLVTAMVCAVLIKGAEHFYGHMPEAYMDVLMQVLLITLVANVSLFTFNLLPLFPLDGHHLMREILPERMRPGFMLWQIQHGRTLLLALIMLPILLRIFISSDVVDPLGFLLRHVLRFAARILLGPG